MNITVYHGGRHRITTFKPEWLGKGAGHDQEGPGFYFTTNEGDARAYAKGEGGFIHTITLSPRKLLKKSDRSKPSEIRKMMEWAPDLEGVLTNWDEDPKKAFNKAFRAMCQPTKAVDAFQQIWYDFYRYYGADYLSGLVALGYDGHIVESGFRRDGSPVTHYVMYNPKVIRVEEVVEYESLEESFNREVKYFVNPPKYIKVGPHTLVLDQAWETTVRYDLEVGHMAWMFLFSLHSGGLEVTIDTDGAVDWDDYRNQLGVGWLVQLGKTLKSTFGVSKLLWSRDAGRMRPDRNFVATLESITESANNKITISDLKLLIPSFVRVAQEIYDDWDEEDGSGGICDLIVDHWMGLFDQFDVELEVGGHDGDDHAWLLVDGKFWVDIDPRTYETGGGYNWKKIEGVKFSPSDVQIGTI